MAIRPLFYCDTFSLGFEGSLIQGTSKITGTWNPCFVFSKWSWKNLTVGDSHEYGDSPTIFYEKEIEDRIRNYLESFLNLSGAQVSERWLGNYASQPSGEPWFYELTDGVLLVNRMGGVDMINGFSLTQEVLPEC